MYSLLFIVLSCSNFPVPRVADDTWKGRKILPRQSPAAIFVDHRYLFLFDDFSLLDSFPYEVRDEKDNWLKIFDGEREGWAQKANFVLLEDAPAALGRNAQAGSKKYVRIEYARHQQATQWRI